MQGFGELLRDVRESKLIDLDKAARETNISRRYIEALETEQFTLFPGEPYLLGFLRNYSEYLELNADELIAIYKKIKLQQSETPEILLAAPKKPPVVPILISVLVLALAASGAFFIVNQQSRKKEAAAKLSASVTEPAEYVLSSTPLEVTLRSGDTVKIPGENNAITDLKVVSTGSFLSFQTPVGVQIVEQGEEIGLDIDGIPGNEFTIFVSRLDKKNASSGASVRMFLTREQQKTPEVVLEQDVPAAAAAVSPTARRVTVFEGNTAYPFTLSATFRGPCVLRYQSDRNERVEELYASGETLLVQANNAIRVWISNANAVKMQVIGGGKTVDLEPGRSGQVSVQDVRWLRDEDGKYRLSVIDVE